MGRPARYNDAAILNAAFQVLATVGPAATTIQAVAEALGAPTGSIYHRFPSRRLILATVWLDTVERFQNEFAGYIARGASAGEIAAQVVKWVRRHPRESSILVLYRREELMGPEIPEPLARRARALSAQVEGAVFDLAERWLGDRSQKSVETVRLAVVDLPYAAVRPALRRRRQVPEHLAGLVASAAENILEEARKR